MIEIRKVNTLLDEVVARKCTIHAERVEDKKWFLEIVDVAKNSLSLEILGEVIVSDSPTRDAEQRDGVAAGDMSEACPPDRHHYYTLLLNYIYCPYCGLRLHS